ncbi:hypothetical protein H2203_003932 [Taxawa tesnikishii (nom. ined.)]|nr:hypothetical protein H2203_003932 [Dothideales sp. JES 119]
MTQATTAVYSAPASSAASSLKTKDTDTPPRETSPDTKREDQDHPQPDQPIKGRICGRKYLDELDKENAPNPEYGPIKEVDTDMRLTLTELLTKNGNEWIVLKYADDDTENPFKWNKWRRRFMSSLLNLMTLFIGLATTAYSSGISSMCSDLNASNELGQMGLFTFNVACAVAPLFLAPFCELVGRKVIYAGAYGCFTLCFVGLALGKNIQTIIVMRLLLGLFGCVGTILVGGTFSDMYDPVERARPMAMFSYVAILGTVGAPIYAGFIDETLGWRWIEGIQGLSNVPLLIIILLFFKETRGGVGLHKRAKQLRQATGDERYVSEMDLETEDLKDLLKASSVKAVHMLVTEPVVFAFGLWIAFAWFVVFLFLSVIPITFQEQRGWSEGVAGLPYISLCIGVTLGYLCHHTFQMPKYEKIANDEERKAVPETRLYGAVFGAAFFPLGLFIYSFTQYGYLPWIAPTIALAPISFGIYFVFESTYSYTSDCYGESSSSAIAAQGLMRNTLGAVSPLFASQFFHNVGSQYAGLILSIIGTFLSLVPLVFFKYGHKLRERSKLAREF